MARTIVITSGKGGVGKTTVTANLGRHLAEKNYRVCMIDMDLGLNNLDVVMNMEDRVLYTMLDVIEHRCRIREALIQDDTFPLLYILSTGALNRNLSIGVAEIKQVVQDLGEVFDFVLIDCPAGIEQGFRNAVAGADKALVITMAEKSAIRDADRIIDLLSEHGIDDVRFIINRIHPNLIKHGYMMNVDDAIDALGVQVVGIVPDDTEIIIAASRNENVAQVEHSLAGKAYRNIAERLTGKHVPIMEMPDEDKFFRKLKKLFSKK